MNNHFCKFSLILLGCLCLTTQSAHAVISCSISSPGFFQVYDSTVATATTTSSSVTINCTRALADPTTQTYSLAATNGLNPIGQINQALLTTFIQYNEYQNATFATLWGPNPPAKNALSGTINFGTGTSVTLNIPYYVSIPALQAAAAGNYTDTVTMTLTYGAATATATHPVLISTIPQCQIWTAPGTIAFTYTSFQLTAAVASTTFATFCTVALPYTMALDAVSGTITGVNYTLALSAASGTGTGVAQTYSINGTVAAGQSGTCATATCTGTQTRTLTVTF